MRFFIYMTGLFDLFVFFFPNLFTSESYFESFGKTFVVMYTTRKNEKERKRYDIKYPSRTSFYFLNISFDTQNQETIHTWILSPY